MKDLLILSYGSSDFIAFAQYKKPGVYSQYPL